ncbi:hypothetical protein SAMN05192534_13810 [Alteribacillus persepolensis]|uniref:Uncharacterized protein n=1 Tax=Alteribacillus persepolensis TaxID=568899 RepID=A0A1G8JWK2_9BACI|nr:hypothetical protein [Alteribacillus persepolensis]SDI35569.1 hypothetical protein SAMN05192534_13810 [Alteribacillus persepolensis]
MKDWNEQASQNNNLKPDIHFEKEALTNKKIQRDIHKPYDTDHDETVLKPKDNH